MKPKTRLLVGLAITSLITLVAAIAILRPSVLLAAALTLFSVLAVLAAQWFLADTIVSRPVPPSSELSMSKEWPQRTGDPDKLVDRLVSSIEDFITNIRENRESRDDLGVRQELHQRLGWVVEQTTGLPVGGQALEVTVVLSDLRGFSVITEGYSPQEVVDMLNRYFDRMCEIIYRYGGTVDKFMGDSIMALFGAPVSRSNYIEHAVCCAVEMQIAMDAFNKENENLGMPNLYMGIGINTGGVIAGKIGSDLHSEYTVIGNEVNLASRIEAYSLRGQILISEKTFSQIRDLVKVENPIYVSVKGRREPTPLYELLSVGEPYNLEVPEREARRSLRVEVNIPFEFQICEGKVVRSDTHEGRILNLSSGGMFASTLAEVEPYFNMRFRLEFNILGVKSSDIYGKILRVKKSAELYEMNIEFTAINPQDRKAIKELVNQMVQSGFMPGA
jgi:adenylate cyclase